MTRLTADWVTAAAPQSVLRALAAAQGRAWFVGGCVRNALLGTSVDDIDLATDLPPDAVVAAVGAAGLRAVPTGLDHGTVTVVAQGQGFEVTTLRRDIDTDGRHAVVAFAKTLDQDAARRDFTMNALYALPDGTVIDPLGQGLADLRAHHLRFIGDPHRRIAEDYLRILRFFRFSAWYAAPENGIDADGLAACAAGADGLGRVSAERLGNEMRKLLAAPDPAPAVAAMAACGVLMRVLPGAQADMLGPLIHLEHDLSVAPDALRRLAALGGYAPVKALRLSKSEARRLKAMAAARDSAEEPGAIGYRFGALAARDGLLLRAAATGAPLDNAPLAAAAQGAAAVFPVRAAHLAADYSGPALGARLKALEEAWIASGFTATRGALLARPE